MSPDASPSSTTPPRIRPIIRELVRTGVHFPDLTLLVDKILIVPRPNSDKDGDDGQDGPHQNFQAYLLYLSDHDRSIQTVVKRRLHRVLDRGEIREGSIVLLKEYRLGRAQRHNGRGEVIFLQADDFYTIGDDGREQWGIQVLEAADIEGRKSSMRAAHEYIGDQPDMVAPKSLAPQEEDRPLTRIDAVWEGFDGEVQSPGTSRKRKKTHHTSSPLGDLDSNLPSSPSKHYERCQGSPATATKRLTQESPTALHKRTPSTPPALGSSSKHFSPSKSQIFQRPSKEQSMYSTPTRNISTPSPSKSSLQTRTPGPGFTSPTYIPVNPTPSITSLSQITGANATKHTLVTVLAQIISVTSHTYKPPSLPLPKRDIRIADASTPKHVLLSVFADAEDFRPQIGTVALFRWCRTHDWEGGNLKKWPRDYVGGWAKRRGFTADGLGDGSGGDEVADDAKLAGDADADWYVPEPGGKVPGVSFDAVNEVRRGVERWKSVRRQSERTEAARVGKKRQD